MLFKELLFLIAAKIAHSVIFKKDGFKCLQLDSIMVKEYMMLTSDKDKSGPKMQSLIFFKSEVFFRLYSRRYR